MHVSDGNNKAEVLIDLTARLDVRKLNSKSELIQQQALDRLADLIIKRLADPAITASKQPDPEDIDADGSNILFDRRHDTITIHGSRGSGKTTFIRNAFRLFRKDEAYREKIGAKVATLGVVDPTLIENKENIFVVILNKIRRAVERHRNNVGDRSACGDEFAEWQKKLRSLAQGLALLDGIGPDRALGDSWDDVQYVLRKGLDKADAGSELEMRFHDFVKSSLDYIGKQAFLMALDDIDTDFKRGWPVLEVLRRYLTSPRFIVVLSGDMDLYTLLVRGQQWEQFADRQLNHDKTQEPGLREMVNHLQAQYLLKVLPPLNRVALRPLSEIEDIKVKLPARAGESPEAVRDMTLGECLREILREGLGLRSNARRNARALLLRQPVRTVVQVLSLLAADAGDRPWVPLAHELPSIFLDSLLRHNTSLDDIYQATGSRAVGYVAKFLTDNRLWDNAQDLLPEHTEDDLNLTLLTVGAWVHRQCQEHPELALEYMLRICFAHELLTNRLQTIKSVSRGSGRERDAVEEPVPLTDFVRFTELERHGSSLEVSRLFVSVINGEDMAGVRLGTVQTYKRGSKLRRDTVAHMYGRPLPSEGAISFATYSPIKESLVRPYYETVRKAFRESALGDTSVLIGNWYNTIDTLQARLTSETMRALVGLPTCRILKPSGERPTFVSVHGIIAGISELLRRAANGNEDGLVRTLRDALNIRSYPVPPWMAKRTVFADAEQSDDWEPLDDETDAMGIRNDPFVQHILNWVQNAKDVRPPPPYVLARVWSRFYFTLAAIDEEVERKDRFLGYLLHRQIVAFLNALLIEEMIYEGVEGANLRNAVTSDRVLHNNLDILWDDENVGKANFFRAIFRCPIWSAYLDTDDFTSAGFVQLAISFQDQDLGILRAGYDIRQISQDQSRKELPEEKRRAIIQFSNLYPLLNSVPVVAGSGRVEGEKKDLSEKKPSPVTRKKVVRNIRGISKPNPPSA